MLTYNLGFFFGPGLPLGLAIASDGIDVDRFTPFAEMSFFFVSLGVVTSCEGAGVENVSEFVSSFSESLLSSALILIFLHFSQSTG